MAEKAQSGEARPTVWFPGYAVIRRVPSGKRGGGEDLVFDHFEYAHEDAVTVMDTLERMSRMLETTQVTRQFVEDEKRLERMMSPCQTMSS